MALDGYSIEVTDYFNYSPGFELAIINWVGMVAVGTLPPTLIYGWDMPTIYARHSDTGRVIGVIVWTKVESSKEAYVIFGVVDECHRRKAVYNALYGKLVEIAREAGLHRVTGATTTGNPAMQLVAKAQGRKIASVQYTQEI
jgi:hypothetical protein